MLALNLGHGPLYRHICKYLNIELLKMIFLLPYIFFAQQFEGKLSFCPFIERLQIFTAIMIFYTTL